MGDSVALRDKRSVMRQAAASRGRWQDDNAGSGVAFVALIRYI